MFTTYAHTLTTYTPHVSSPLSSSPLRNSPSPLSPRDVNQSARKPDLEMSSPTPTSKRSSQSKPTSTSFTNSETPMKMKTSLPSPPPSRGRAGRESVYSKRVTKANPLMDRNKDEGREARRKLFLKRVREGSEEKKWRDRTNSGLGEGEDEVLRAIWVAEERRRKEGRRREAEVMGIQLADEDLDLSLDEVMADEVAMNEEEELEALLGSLGQPQEEMDLFEGDLVSRQDQQQMETPYGSDDEEYDHIFMDVIEEENRMASQQHQQQQVPGYLDADHEMMDLS